MKWAFALAFIAIFHGNQAQSVSTRVGARAAGMGYAASPVVDVSALFNNPGALGGLNSSSTFFTYEISPLMPGASRTAAAMAIRMKPGVAGIGIFRFGDDVYSEQVASVAFSNKFGITSLGAKVNYVQYNAAGLGTATTVSIDFGGRVQITPQVVVSACISNPTQSMIGEEEPLPTRMVAGLGFKLDENILLTTEISKDMDYESTWRSGIEYRIYNKVFVRTGYNLNPSMYFAGLGGASRRLRIDYAIQVSNALGTTHQGSATFLIVKNPPNEK